MSPSSSITPGGWIPSRQTTKIIEEGRLLARVHHQNVVTIYGAEHHAGQVGLWMEFIEGSTLEEILTDQGPLSPDETMVIGRDVCRALAALHDSGAIHRDIKASNVMRETGGRIVLMDLGVSCEIDGDVPVSQYGTPLYRCSRGPAAGGMRPARATSTVSVSCSFIWSPAIFRFLDRLWTEVREAHIDHRIRSLKEMCPDPQNLPDAFVQIVQQALAPDPAQRFQRAEYFEAALVEALGERAREFDLPREGLPSIAVTAFRGSESAEGSRLLVRGSGGGGHQQAQPPGRLACCGPLLFICLQGTKNEPGRNRKSPERRAPCSRAVFKEPAIGFVSHPGSSTSLTAAEYGPRISTAPGRRWSRSREPFPWRSSTTCELILSSTKRFPWSRHIPTVSRPTI